MNSEQFERMRSGAGFIAALDQSGGSTPKALRLYGIEEDSWSSEDEMFDLVHGMRQRIITSPVFTSERILAAILFEMTMDREIEGASPRTTCGTRRASCPSSRWTRGWRPRSTACR